MSEKRGSRDLSNDELYENPEDNEIASTFDYKLENWLKRVNTEEIEPVMYIYKYNTTTASKRRLCGKFVGIDLPDEHAIGLNYGGGKYMASVVIPTSSGEKPKQTSFHFEIDSCYDQMKRQAALSGNTPTITPLGLQSRIQPVSAPIGESSPNHSMEYFREGMAFVTDLIAKIQLQPQPQPQPVMPDMSSILLQQYKMMSETLKSNLLETDRLMHSTLKNRLKEGETETGEETHETEEPPLLQKLLSEFLPLLTTLLSTQQAAPAVRQVLQNPNVINKTANIVKSSATPSPSEIQQAAKKRPIIIKKSGNKK